MNRESEYYFAKGLQMTQFYQLHVVITPDIIPILSVKESESQSKRERDNDFFVHEKYFQGGKISTGEEP